MRVLVIAKDFPSAAHPGAGIFVLRQIRALAELGHTPYVVRVVPHAPPWGERWRAYRAVPDRDDVEGVAVETIRALVPPRMIGLEYLPLQVRGALHDIVARFEPDLVHAHFLIPSGQLAVGLGLPTIVTAHGSDAYEWAWRRSGLRRAATHAIARASVVTAVSDFIAGHVRALHCRNVKVVFNGADDDVFAPSQREAARRELGLEPGRFIVAFAGRPSRAKGAFDLVEAAARIRDVRPLLLLAGPPFDQHLARCIADGGVDVRAMGMLGHRELARVLTAADVFALPSYREGLPATLCEAMLSGRAAVTTPVGGIAEIVRDGVDGFLVPTGDVEALAARLRALAIDPSLAHRVGEAAHRFARQNLTWRANAARYDELYREAVLSPGAVDVSLARLS